AVIWLSCFCCASARRSGTPRFAASSRIEAVSATRQALSDPICENPTAKDPAPELPPPPQAQSRRTGRALSSRGITRVPAGATILPSPEPARTCGFARTSGRVLSSRPPLRHESIREESAMKSCFPIPFALALGACAAPHADPRAPKVAPLDGETFTVQV